MEKKFIQSMLLSTAVLVVYTLVSPPLHLSAESAPELDPATRVRKGTVISIDTDMQKLVIDFNGVSVPVHTNASTTLTSPNGEETELSSLREGSAVYVFGYFDSRVHTIEASKIVERNRSIMERRSPSRADLENMKQAKESPSLLGDLNFTVK